MFMSDVIRLNGNSKRLRVRANGSALSDYSPDMPNEEDYIQTNLQNYYDKGYNDGRESAETEIRTEYEKRFIKAA